MDRLGFLKEHVDLSTATALEIGALARPLLTSEMANVVYLDHLSTEGLREKYRIDPDVDKARIVDVRYVWSGGSMSSAVHDGGTFSLVVASHVFEHFANPIGWLLDARKLLAPGGMLFLALPDKRFTFDSRRNDSELSDWVGWYLRGLERPAADQVFDYFANVSHVSVSSLWNDVAYRAPEPMYAIDQAFEMARTAASEYVDAHCSVFTPYQFIELCRGASRLGLFPYRVAAFLPTSVNDMEFLVLLQAMDAAGEAPLTNDRRQEIARAAGYGGEFGGGAFVRAIDADAGLRQRYDAMIAEAQVRARSDGFSFPDVDRTLHHERPAAGDPRVSGAGGTMRRTGGWMRRLLRGR